MNRIIVAAACGVAIWRVAALVLLSSQADPTGDALIIKALLAALGMVFVACGLLVFLKLPSRASLLFAGFCICSGLHWGGPLELPPGQLRTALILFYLLVSSFLGSTFLLHFALYCPRKLRVAQKQFVMWLLYAPVVVATALAVVYLVSPAESDLRATAQGLFLILHEIVSNLFAVVALVLVVSCVFRAGLTRVQKRYVVLMATPQAAATMMRFISIPRRSLPERGLK